jgi:hypothetical protein
MLKTSRVSHTSSVVNAACFVAVLPYQNTDDIVEDSIPSLRCPAH